MKTQIRLAALATVFTFSGAMALAQGTMSGPMNDNSLVPGAAPQSALPSIPVGNHYVCYPVKGAQFKPRTATFRDQFGAWTVTVIGITRLCAPAEKRADGKVYEMVNKGLHLTCYTIRYQGGALPPVMTNDQFGPQKLTLAPATEVCLPAGKAPIR
jgi:hypothetical protein